MSIKQVGGGFVVKDFAGHSVFVFLHITTLFRVLQVPDVRCGGDGRRGDLCRTPKERSRPIKKYRSLLMKNSRHDGLAAIFHLPPSDIFFTASDPLTGEGQS